MSLTKNVYFWSDPHFGHKNIITYSHRPFKDVGSMNSALVENFINTVPANSTVFILGDIFEPKYLASFQNYELHLILGNHDRSAKKRTEIESVIKNSNLNMKVYEFPICINKFIWLSHEPMEFLPEELPYLNIHGHIHDKIYDGRTWDQGGRHFNVSVENTAYCPISILDVSKRMGIENIE